MNYNPYWTKLPGLCFHSVSLTPFESSVVYQTEPNQSCLTTSRSRYDFKDSHSVSQWMKIWETKPKKCDTGLRLWVVIIGYLVLQHIGI